MPEKTKKSLVPEEHIAHSIFIARGQKVMLDMDLARLYGVETFNLNKAVKRNKERFPEDFMFQLTPQEMKNLTFQIGISNGRGGRRTLPYAFTEQGIAMLSGVLNSSRAVEVNIAIMRAFVKLRVMLQSQDTIKHELAALKQAFKHQFKEHDDQIKTIFMMIDEIVAPPPPKKKRSIGFVRNLNE